MAEFDQARHLARQPTAVELALWFHDAVYDAKAGDNEERSAELAACCLGDARVPSMFIESVRRLVMATKRHEAEPGSDEAGKGVGPRRGKGVGPRSAAFSFCIHFLPFTPASVVCAKAARVSSPHLVSSG